MTNQMTTDKVLFHDWQDSTPKDVFESFSAKPEDYDGATILAAAYTYEDYSGSAMVLYEKDGKLFVNHGGHCSCYGLEGQWSPEEVTKADADFYYSGYGDEFTALVKGIIAARFPAEAQ